MLVVRKFRMWETRSLFQNRLTTQFAFRLMLVGGRSPLGLYDLQLIIVHLAKARQICAVLRVTLVIEQLKVAKLCVQLSCLVTCVTRTGISRIRLFCSISTVTGTESSYYGRVHFSCRGRCVLHSIILS